MREHQDAHDIIHGRLCIEKDIDRADGERYENPNQATKSLWANLITLEGNFESHFRECKKSIESEHFVCLKRRGKCEHTQTHRVYVHDGHISGAFQA